MIGTSLTQGQPAYRTVSRAAGDDSCHSQTNIFVPREPSEYKPNELDWIKTSSGTGSKCQCCMGVCTRVALNVKRLPCTNAHSSACCGVPRFAGALWTLMLRCLFHH